MSEKEFDLGLFIDTVMAASSDYTEEEQQRHARVLRLYRDIVTKNEITEEWLQSIMMEDLEWIMDMVMYWPSFEMDLEKEDWNHVGVQSYSIEGIIRQLQKIPSIRKGVTFF